FSAYAAQQKWPWRNTSVKGPITYHDSCQAVHGLRISQEPRRLLQSVPQLDFRELPDSPCCCGGAGTYWLEHPELWQKVLDVKMDHIRRSGASTVVTTATSCILHIRYGAKKNRWPLNVMHLSQLIEEATHA